MTHVINCDVTDCSWSVACVIGCLGNRYHVRDCDVTDCDVTDCSWSVTLEIGDETSGCLGNSYHVSDCDVRLADGRYATQVEAGSEPAETMDQWLG